MIYLTLNDHDKNNAIDDPSIRIFAQHLDSDVGKVLRLRDDGSIPSDNPFVGREDANPQVFTYGHRNPTDFAWHPTTGELWATEIGQMGGDEINILRGGENYGWPLVSLGRLYTKGQVSEQHWYREGMEMPVVYWTPSISPNSLVWYTGDKLPPWRGHLFVGALNGQTLVRIAFDQPAPQSERRDSLFMSLGRRWRHVAQSPDGYLYAVLDAGIAVCWDSATGKEMWKSRLDGTFSSSLVLAGDNLFATNEQSQTFVFKAKPSDFEQVAVNQLEDECMSTPAICDSRIYVRVASTKDDQRQEVVYCLGK
jgi:glucose/arabinose dehydrogenase